MDRLCGARFGRYAIIPEKGKSSMVAAGMVPGTTTDYIATLSLVAISEKSTCVTYTGTFKSNEPDGTAAAIAGMYGGIVAAAKKACS